MDTAKKALLILGPAALGVGVWVMTDNTAAAWFTAIGGYVIAKGESFGTGD